MIGLPARLFIIVWEVRYGERSMPDLCRKGICELMAIQKAVLEGRA